MSLTVAVTGAGGQVGRALLASGEPGYEIIGAGSSEVDVRSWNQVRDWLASVRPNFVIHAAAMTDVDGCESSPQAAFDVNALGTRNVARASSRVGATLVYVSTNFVFDGHLDRPYHEFDDPRPLSVYGASKRSGELEAISGNPDCYVVRTAMVFYETGHNFVNSMRRLMSERDELTIVNDQVGNPTYAPDFAAGVLELVKTCPPGAYHLTNNGSTSWFGWAEEIQRITGLECKLQPIPGREYQRAAEVPANGALASIAWSHGASSMRPWQDALQRCLNK